MTYTLPFQRLSKNDIPLAGGKGANLGELAQSEIPVPPGFVITTQAYKDFVAANQLQAQIMTLAAQPQANNPATFESASENIRALFVQGEMPADLAREITRGYAQLIEKNGPSTGSGNGHAVAVRSSATAEDLPDASFAGQQDTYLNVQGDNALLLAVKNCWGSLWTARAISYRMRQAIDPADVSLAVVVQQLVPADSAGILFTANPTSGEREQIVINATWGLGEAIVGGLVTPDTVMVDQSSWEILSRETTTKTVMTVRTDTGTEEQAVPQAQQTQQVLDDATAISLAGYGAKISAHYQMPMDIEWAIADDQIAILQARPITSLPPAPPLNVVWEPIAPNTIWMRRQIVEHMPEPLSPLFEDLYLNQGMKQSINKLMVVMGEIGSVDLDIDAIMPHGFAGTINGYAYTTGSFEMNRSNVMVILRIYARLNRFFNVSAFDWEGVVWPDYQALIARWGAMDLAQATDEALLRGISEMAAADSGYWFGSAMNLGLSRFMDPVFDQLLKSALIRDALPTRHTGSSSFLRGFDSKALDAQADMEALANMIRQSAELRELVTNTQALQLITALAAHPNGQPVLDSIERYLDQYGHQIYNLDFVSPTQNEEPLPMLLSLKALAGNPPAQDVRSRQAKMAAERDALVEHTMQATGPLSRRLFGWVWKWTKYYAPYREHVMFYMGAAWPTVRKLAHELGQRLTDAGTIASADDIYYLDSSEITKAIHARANGQNIPEFVQLVQERRDLREARKQLTPLPKVPEGRSLKVGPFDLSMFDPTPTDAAGGGPVLNGYAVSTGRVTAKASVIHSIKDFNQMKPGTILVCTTTTPAWTPLFSQAVGLVTDVGGALAHGSIVAREYGIPAVMGTGVATERIKSGMMLAVDGNAGTVTLVDEMPPLPEESAYAQDLVSEQAGADKKPAKTRLALMVGMLMALIWWWKKRE